MALLTQTVMAQNLVIKCLEKRDLSREGVDKREKEGAGALKHNVSRTPFQLSLLGGLEELDEKGKAGKTASAEQVRGGCSDLCIFIKPVF